MARRRRRICWPNPDKICLEGGCSYCSDGPVKGVLTIQNWVKSTNDPELWESFVIGRELDWNGR